MSRVKLKSSKTRNFFSLSPSLSSSPSPLPSTTCVRGSSVVTTSSWTVLPSLVKIFQPSWTGQIRPPRQNLTKVFGKNNFKCYDFKYLSISWSGKAASTIKFKVLSRFFGHRGRNKFGRYATISQKCVGKIILKAAILSICQFADQERLYQQ